jgi:hypothetical protein
MDEDSVAALVPGQELQELLAGAFFLEDESVVVTSPRAVVG